ncbi:delta-like protein 4 [Ylistrum balloti]|uniref:delta-like protein 4 n=1 Tax=Ylistrum balloti TaxID=509963 RepID=UPI002905AC62|nr:delta-like protein 4 [Ylistrum balloti]
MTKWGARNFSTKAGSRVVSSGGTGMLKLLSYDNPTQQLASGQCCDHFLYSRCKTNQCDPKFTVCVNQQPVTSQCSLARAESHVFNDTNSVIFNDTFGDVSNPLHFNFSSWKTGFVVSVTVQDVDIGGSVDTMDIMVQSQFLDLKNGPVHNGLSMRGSKGRLQLEYSLACDPGYYGDCSLSCQVKNNSYCAPNGTLICYPGFTGNDCATDIDECQSNPCSNGGTCQDGNNSFSCLCPYGHSGPMCNVAVSTTTASTTIETTVSTSTTLPGPNVTSTTSSKHSAMSSSTSRVVSSKSSTSRVTSITSSLTSLSTSSIPRSYQTHSTATTSTSRSTNGSSSQSAQAQKQVAAEEDNTTLVLGGVVGGLLCLLLLLLLVGYFVRKHFAKKKSTVDAERRSSSNRVRNGREITANSRKPTIPDHTDVIPW